MYLHKIDTLFQNILTNDKVLQKIPITNYKELLTASNTSQLYRPTLFDFLAREAIDFYTYKNRDILNELPYKSLEKLFHQNLSTTEIQELKLPQENSISIFQKLEAFHINSNTNAYVHAVLDRYNFLRNTTSKKYVDQLYVNALIQLSEKFKGKEISAFINYKIADFYFSKTLQNNSKYIDSLKNYRIKALQICNNVLSNYAEADGGNDCKILKNKITESELNFTTEQIITPNKPFLAKLDYKNVTHFNFLIYPINAAIFNSAINDSIIITQINTIKPIKKQDYNIDVKSDYYNHTTEVPVDNLHTGYYIMIATITDSITKKEDILAYKTIQASKLTLATQTIHNKERIFITNRNSGNAIKNVNITINGDHFKTNGVTNSQGVFEFKLPEKSQELSISVSNDHDTLQQKIYTHYYNDNENKNDTERIANMYLFTDRSIYRPGQTIYFKGILSESNGNTTKVIANTYVSITIYDANNNEIKFFRLKTNDFGSVNESYQLPKNILTGEFTIEMDEDYNEDGDDDTYYEDVDDVNYKEIAFSVEEYKRPRFQVIFNDSIPLLSLNDTTTIKGQAKSFFGAAITNAKVIYTINRTQEQPYTYPRKNLVYTDSITTNEKGFFEIPFTATVDTLNINNNQLIYKYTIKATVTDINGETRDAEKAIRIGKHNLNVSTDIPSQLDQNFPQFVNITTTDLNQQKISSSVFINIYKLKENTRITRKKPWHITEEHYLSKEEFIKKFPHDVYDSLDLNNFNVKDSLVFSKHINTPNSKNISLQNLKNWQPGTYQIELSASNAKNDTAQFKHIFKVNNPHKKTIENTMFNYEIANANFDFKKDQYILLKLKSGLDSLPIYIQAFYNKNEIYNATATIINHEKFIKIPVKKTYTNDIQITIYGNKFNSSIYNTFHVGLVEQQQNLQIETETFRNKLTPDQPETWSFKILNPDTSPATAEVLATMYDTSLDDFKKHDWDTNFSFSRYNSNSFYINFYNNYQTRNSKNLTRTTWWRNSPSILRFYHQFNWFGFNFNNPQYANNIFLNQLKKGVYSKKTQKGTIYGIVTDEKGLPLPGVSIYKVGTNEGTTSDFDGYYAINANKDDVLSYTYVGFNAKNISIAKKGMVNVVLNESAEHLDEVVVVGYGTQKMKDSISDVLKVLSGRVAGLDIQRKVSMTGAVTQVYIRGASTTPTNTPLYIIDGVPAKTDKSLTAGEILDIQILKKEEATALYGNQGVNGVIIITTKSFKNTLKKVAPRKDFKETAFFYPNLKTDKQGIVKFSFTTPQALTEWRLMLLAHNKNLQYANINKYAITQKDLNIVPNPPRFVTAHDTIIFSTKINNLSKTVLHSLASLQLYNGITMQPLNNGIKTDSIASFSLPKGGNTEVHWKLIIPEGIEALSYKIIAKANNFSDGEENTIAVLPSKIRITESKTAWIKPNDTAEFKFENFVNNSSAPLKNEQVVLEYTSNPIWNVIKALPYLIEFPYECAEQTFSRYYANTIAEHILENQPEIKNVITSWQNIKNNTPLEQNEDLKSTILEETPWVKDAMSEGQQRKNLALLLSETKTNEQLTIALDKLKNMQLSNGAFPWFSGGSANVYITTHIIAGFGHLKNLGVVKYKKTPPFLNKAISYVDKYYSEKGQKESLISHDILHYWYARSFFIDLNPLTENQVKSTSEILEKINDSWLAASIYDKSLMSLIAYRFGAKQLAKKIITALEEQAVKSNENGIYWKENTNGYYWYNDEVETQALLLEAFNTISPQQNVLNGITLWLLKHKQTHQWKTTKTTTEAIYAILNVNKKSVSTNSNVEISLNNNHVDTNKLEKAEQESKTGYIKLQWRKDEISNQLGKIKIKNIGKVPATASAYWQYFEDLDNISSQKNNDITIEKFMFLKNNDGTTVKPLHANSIIKKGDLITVKLRVHLKDNMEFIHIKDMRASGLEPIDVISKYQWKNNMNYYQTTKDVATHFFFDHLNKGDYVIEYDLRANNSGHFSTGITTIENMYAPQFNNHTSSNRIIIK
ncbi:MG2 domain-containing protein [Zhouia sp. PK063]|uniref:alpha-2-macroglobulin family protein n=1 Tax=Zhouia sp. PK063 TaxID=3373602 RepID=UPI0037AD5F4F